MPKSPPPQVGEVVDGFSYVGGNPANDSAWAPASGDKFLNSIQADDGTKTMIKGIANYELPPGSSRGGLGSPQVQQLLSFAKQYNPKFDVKNYQAVQKARTAMADPNAKFSQTKMALNTAIDHIAGLAGDVDSLDNYDTPALNWMKNTASDAMGDPRQVKFHENAVIGADEIIKAITGGQGGGEQDRRQMEGMFRLNGSKAQQKAAIAKAVQLLGGKLDEMQASYGAAIDPNGDKLSMLSPSARKSWQKLSQSYGAEAPHDGGAPMQQQAPSNGGWSIKRVN